MDALNAVMQLGALLVIGGALYPAHRHGTGYVMRPAAALAMASGLLLIALSAALGGQMQ